MNVDALRAFADEHGLLREDVLRRGGPAIARSLESALGPGPWCVEQIESLLRGEADVVNENTKYRVLDLREQLPYRTAEFEQLMRLIDGLDEDGLHLEEQDIDYILHRQEERALQEIQPLFSKFVDESTISAGPDQPHFRELSLLVHDLFEVVGKICRKAQQVPKSAPIRSESRYGATCSSCRFKETRLDELEHSLAEALAESQKHRSLAQDLNRQLSAKCQEFAELKKLDMENSSLAESQRERLVRQKLDFAEQMQLHSQASRLSDAHSESSKEAIARARELQEQLANVREEVAKHKEENQSYGSALQSSEDANALLTQEVCELKSFVSAKAATIAELEQLLEEERARAARVARASNDEQKHAELRKCQDALRRQEQRNEEIIEDLRRMAKRGRRKSTTSCGNPQPTARSSLGSIQDFVRVLAPPIQKNEDNNAVDGTVTLQKLVHDLTGDLLTKSKEVEELRAEAMSWGRSWGSCVR